MPPLTQKINMYISQSGAQPSTVARYLNISTNKLNDLLAGDTAVTIPEEGFARLAAESGVPESVWRDDSQSLPDELPFAVRKGRKPKSETPEWIRDQNSRRRRLNEVITRYGSKETFAQAIGQQPSAISHYLNARAVTDGFLLKVAKATGISANWLLSGEGTIDDKSKPEQSATRHEGELLGRHLEERGISNRTLGLLMGHSEANAGPAVHQYRRSRQLSSEVKERLFNALNVTELELFSQKETNSLPNIENKQDSELQGVDEMRIFGTREKSPIHSLAATIDLPLIPAHLRAGFHFNQSMPQLRQLSIPPHRLKNLQNPNLTPEQRAQEISRYCVIRIGTDYMEPAGLMPGFDAIMYRLPEESWPDASGVLAVEKTNGQLRIGRVRENNLSSEGHLNFVLDNPKGGSFSVDQADIENLFKLETFLGDVV